MLGRLGEKERTTIEKGGRRDSKEKEGEVKTCKF
jgi:hypothetical protein